jgi:lysophospholipase L1-like esterase
MRQNPYPATQSAPGGMVSGQTGTNRMNTSTVSTRGGPGYPFSMKEANMITKNAAVWIIASTVFLACLVSPLEAGEPKVLMLGDSITMHYTPFVIEILKGQADVYRCKENSNWSGRLLKELLTGILDAEGCKWDVVWFNVGNWDITPATARFIRKNPDWGFKDGEAKTSLADYEKNLGELIRRIRTHSPEAKLVFCTTTYIPQVGADAVEQYNQAATRAMKKQNVPVFDLYSVTKPHVDLLLYKNNTHFSKVANQKILAPYIARALKSFIKEGSLPTGSPLSIPKTMVPALEEDRDLGHPKSRGKGKKKKK